MLLGIRLLGTTFWCGWSNHQAATAQMQSVVNKNRTVPTPLRSTSPFPEPSSQRREGRAAPRGLPGRRRHLGPAALDPGQPSPRAAFRAGSHLLNVCIVTTLVVIIIESSALMHVNIGIDMVVEPPKGLRSTSHPPQTTARELRAIPSYDL